MTSQTVTGSRLTGYIVNVMRSPVIERLMVRGSQVALKYVIHDMEARTLVMELRRRAIKRWVPCRWASMSQYFDNLIWDTFL